MFAIAETLLGQLVYLLPALLGLYLIFYFLHNLLFKDN